MFISTTDAFPEWSSDDAAVLKAFLESSTGQKAITLLTLESPSLADGHDVNVALVTSGRVDGYSLALNNLFSLRTQRPKESDGASPEAYPDIDNEALWPDRTTPTPTK